VTDPGTAAGGSGPRNAVRESVTAFVGALAAAGLLFWSVGERWASGRGRAANALIVIDKHVSGKDVAPLVAAAALVAVAGAVAIPATRRWGRTVAGVLLVLAGVGATVEALLRRTTAQHDLRHKLPQDAVTHATNWPWMAVVGGVLLVLVGALVAVRGRQWSGMSSRYERPATRQGRAKRVDTDVAAWDALDRGEDPTA